MLYQTDGIVLSGIPYGEYDRFITIFTRDEGMVQGSVKGARKPDSKLGPLTQPFCRGAFQLNRGKELHRVTQVALVTSYPGITGDFEKTVYASYLAELVMELISPHEKAQDQYALFVAAMDDLERRKDPWPVAKWAETAMMWKAGFAPTLDSCVVCGRGFEGDVRFSPGLGGAVCHRCTGEIPQWDEPLSVSPGALKTLEILGNSENSTCPNVTAKGRVRDEVNRILRSYSSHVLSRRLKSSSLVERIEREEAHRE